MAKNFAEQVNVNKKLAIEKSPEEQLEIIKEYTIVHKKNLDKSKELREIKCLNVLYPRLFRKIEPEDIVIGRVDALAIGFGCVTSVGGVGHYCNFNQLNNLKNQLESNEDKRTVDSLMNYWEKHDTRSIFFRQMLTETTLGKFVDVRYPAIATARLSGMYLDYSKLIDLGIPGLKKEIIEKRKKNTDQKAQSLYDALEKALELLVKTIHFHIDLAINEMKKTTVNKRKKQMNTLVHAFRNILNDKPKTFIEGIQLTWLYSLLSSVVNYGRMDDYLGDLLVNDLEQKRLTEEEAKEYIKSLFKLIEARKTTVNGRVIVGGKGRRNPKNADKFCKLAIQAMRENQDTEPQFTLKIYDGMDESIYEDALDAIGSGLTYPILYNDDVNIPAVMKSMNVERTQAEQYVPFGCGEFVISHKSVGTPNTCINMLKILNISLNKGIDPSDNLDKSGGVELLPPEKMETFDDVFNQYKRLLNYYVELTAKAQSFSYEVMNKECSFLFTSLLTDDCIDRGRALLDGGVHILGGTNETYGNINASDSLAAIKKVVYDDQKYTLSEVVEAMNNNFVGYENIRKELVDAPKYGNDDEYADSIAVELHEFICNLVRDSAKNVNLDSYLIVIINNQVNTEWGRATSASADGRLNGLYLNNGNNPQGGADKNGPTAMLNSLVKLKPSLHAGSVQNIKFTPEIFNNNRPVVRSLFKTYFENGGPQLMITVVGRGVLEDAYHHPEKYPNLLVRVGGFSAKFVNLERDVQEDVISRTING